MALMMMVAALMMMMMSIWSPTNLKFATRINAAAAAAGRAQVCNRALARSPV